MANIFLLQIKNSLMLGCQYSLIAIGFTLFFGVLNVCVFCQGDFAILGLFLSSTIITFILSFSFNIPIIKGALVLFSMFTAIFITGYIGVVFERKLLKPLRKSPPLMSLLLTAATGIVIEQALKNFYPQGSNPQVFPLEFDAVAVKFGGFIISISELLILLTTIFILILMYIFINKTKIGNFIQAISQDFEAAAMMGINVDKGIAITFLVGVSLASIAGIMNGIYYSVFRYNAGAMLGIKGFSASVAGGLGSIFGAIMGGFLMAFVETFAAAYIPGASPYRDVFSFMVVLFFLIFKPAGILGKDIKEKV